MPTAKVLLVDDDAVLRMSLAKVLELHDFEVTQAGNVAEALKHITMATFDVLLSDLHMPNAGDGLTAVSAMRHSNPNAVTMLFSAFPQMDAATHAILLQADEILVKPMSVDALIKSIMTRLGKGAPATREVESVATILQRTSTTTISAWLVGVHEIDKLMAIPLSDEVRSEHLPQLFFDLVSRLRSFTSLGTKELKSSVATQHGITRRRQGYTADMMVEESRLLQVSVFQTLQNNLATIDFSVLLIGVMTIADEIDSQLSQAMQSYIQESHEDAFSDSVPA